MANSTVTVGNIVAWLKSFPEIAPLVQTAVGGSSLQPALTIVNDVMTEVIDQNYNWRWNRFTMPLIYTNGFQQDYATNAVNLGWLEHGVLIDINNTAIPKPVWPLEIVRDLPETFAQYGRPGQVCWLPNNQLYYATWGASNVGNNSRGLNPGPNMVIGPVLGVYAAPINPILQIQDPNGNFWTVTTFGTTGASQPSWPTNPVYPTTQNPNQAATTVTDGTVVWTAVNPNGFGIRCNPLPPQTGIVYQFYLIGQYRPFAFSNGLLTSFQQTIEPVPDDFVKYFRDGCLAYAYRHSSDAKIRAKFQDSYNMWIASLKAMCVKADRERDAAGFFPANPIMGGGGMPYPGPSFPFPLPWA
jgi:hypothetical protein